MGAPQALQCEQPKNWETSWRWDGISELPVPSSLECDGVKQLLKGVLFLSLHSPLHPQCTRLRGSAPHYERCKRPEAGEHGKVTAHPSARAGNAHNESLLILINVPIGSPDVKASFSLLNFI